jgi:hypothetical protein
MWLAVRCVKSVQAGLGVVVDAAVGAGAAGLVLVPPRGDEVDERVDEADGGEQPVEVVEAALVKVVGDPRVAVAGDAVHGDDERGADEEAKRERAEEQPRAHGLHALGALAEEEVELADVGEGLAGADEEELRDEPEHGHGDDAVGRHVLPVRDGEAPDLGERGDGHGDDGEHEAHGDALQRGEAVRVAAEAARDGHHEAVVDGHGKEDGADEEDGEGAGRDAEAGADAAVHGGGLRHREGGHLRVHRPEHDGGGPDREHPHHRLHLLHVGQRRQPPLARLRRSFLVDGRVVKEAACNTQCKTLSLSVQLVHRSCWFSDFQFSHSKIILVLSYFFRQISSLQRLSEEEENPKTAVCARKLKSVVTGARFRIRRETRTQPN